MPSGAPHQKSCEPIPMPAKGLVKIKGMAQLAMLFALLMAVGFRDAHAAIIALEIDMPLDKVAADRPGPPLGEHHRARIFYDDTRINAKTRRVPVIHMQHMMMGSWVPARIGDVTMPMGDAWLDLSRKPYRYHYRGSMVLGEPITVHFSATSRRMTISKQSNGALLIGAPYLIEETPVAGLQLMVVAAAADHDPAQNEGPSKLPRAR
jgi:hypothetical protein